MSISRRPLLVLLLGILAALAVAVPSSGAEATICPPAEGQIAMAVSATPAQVSPSTAERPSYTQLEVLVENCGPSTKNGAILDVGMPVGAEPSGCSLAADGRCSIGTLRAGTQYAVRLTVAAPMEEGGVAPASLRYQDESSNPNEPETGLSVVTAAIPLTVGVQPGAASTWVPAGVDTTLFATAGGQTAEVRIPGQAAGFPASLGRDNEPFTCPRKLVCRTGAWFTASILDGAELENGLRHELTWPPSQLDRKQSVRNLVVLHELDTGELKQLKAPCAPGQLNCVESATLDARGLTAVVRTATNGRMR